MSHETFLREVETRLPPLLRRTNWKPRLQRWIDEHGKTSWYRQDVTEAIQWLGTQGLPKTFPIEKLENDKSSNLERFTSVSQKLNDPGNPWYGGLRADVCKLEGDFIMVVPEAAGRSYDPLGENVHVEFLNRVAPLVNEVGFPKTVADFASRYGTLFAQESEHVAEWAVAAHYLSFYDSFLRELREATPGARKRMLRIRGVRAFFKTFEKTLRSTRTITFFDVDSGKLIWSWGARSLWAYMCLGLFLNHFQRDVEGWRNLKLCANPRCPSPYFFEKRLNAKYCCAKCMREASNLRYEQTEKRKKQKQKYNRDYYRNKRAKKKAK